MKWLLLAWFPACLLTSDRLLAAPGNRGAVLGKVTWVAISSRDRKKLMGRVRRISTAASQPVTFLDHCKTAASCLRAARRARAAVLLTARVEALGNTYLFQIQGRCLQTKGKVIKERAACEVCTLQEAGRRLGKALVAMARRTRQTACRRQRDRESTAARHGVAAGGGQTEAGPAAATRPAQPRSPGQETNKAARPPAGPVRSGHPSPAGTDQSAPTEPKTGSTSPRARLASRLKLSGWILGGLSLGALAGGSVLLALDGKGTCSGSGECPKVYDFKAPGIATLALGGLGLAAAVTMVVLGYHWDESGERQADLESAPRWILTAAPMPGGLTLGAAGRF